MANNSLSTYSDSRLKVKAAGQDVKKLITSLSDALTQLGGPWDRIIIHGTSAQKPEQHYIGPDDRIWIDPWPVPEQVMNSLTAWRHARTQQASAWSALSQSEKESSASPLEQETI